MYYIKYYIIYNGKRNQQSREKKQSSNYQHRIDDKGNIVSVNGGITFNPNDKVNETYRGPTYDPDGIYDESDIYERWGYIKPESRRDVK